MEESKPFLEWELESGFGLYFPTLLNTKWAFTKRFTVSTLQRKFFTKARAPFASILKSFSSGAYRLYDFATKVYFLSSVTTYAELAYKCCYHCELHTNESEMVLNYQQLCLRLSHLSMLVEQNSIPKSFVRIVFYTSVIRNAFASNKPPNTHFCEHFLQISHNLKNNQCSAQINISGEKPRKLDTLAKVFHCILTRLSDNVRIYWN